MPRRRGRFVEFGSFSIYEQPKWERIVASTQVGFRVSIWVRIRIRVWIMIRVRVVQRPDSAIHFMDSDFFNLR